MNDDCNNLNNAMSHLCLLNRYPSLLIIIMVKSNITMAVFQYRIIRHLSDKFSETSRFES